MIIYAVEICIEQKVAEEWLKWMNLKHIPDVMKTKLFRQFKILKNIEVENSYTIQYELNTMDEYLKYEKYFAPNLQKEHTEKFKGQFKAKRSLFKT